MRYSKMEVGAYVNFVEVMELHRVIGSFCCKNLSKPPKLSIFDSQNKEQGYLLYIKAEDTSGEGFLNFLKTVAETRKLELRKHRDSFVLQSLSSWSTSGNF
jgi:hypothetical protein